VVIAMRIILKILAAPLALLLTLVVALCTFLLSMTGFLLWLVSGVVFIASVVMLFTGQTAGGIAFLVIAFLLSPYGLPAFAAWLVGKLDGVSCSLKEFIFD
jgi:hypothetical protein